MRFVSKALSESRVFSSNPWNGLIGLLVIAAILLLTLPSAYAEFFKVAKRDGRWWLFDQNGQEFLSRGVNTISIGPSLQEFDINNPAYFGLRFYRSADQWTVATMNRLRSWRFNTIGGYSSREIIDLRAQPYAIALTLGGWIGVPWLDIQTAKATKKISELAQALVRYRDDPMLIGYFIDNELGWWDEALFQYVAKQSWKHRLKQRLWHMLKEEYRGDVHLFKRDFTVTPQPNTFEELKGKLEIDPDLKEGRRPQIIERFTEVVAEEYYRTVTTAVRKVDPNHLILCDRYASFYSQPVVKAASRHCDVISTNYNTLTGSGWVSPSFFDTLYRLSRKPILVSEFYFSAMENRTGNKNQNGPYIVVNTQKERQAGAKQMVDRLAGLPYIVGYHWFQFADQPPKGRMMDGEDFNFGLVDVQNQPYEQLVSGLAKVNSNANELHRVGPIRMGLMKVGRWWAVPLMREDPKLDGDISEWNPSASWVPGIQSKQPFEPFGDFYLSWTPSGLWVGVVYMNYVNFKTSANSLLDHERLFIAITRGSESPIMITLTHLPEEGNHKTKTWKTHSSHIVQLKPYTKSDQGLPRALGNVRGSRKNTGQKKIIEALIPVAVLGGQPLRPGETLRVGVGVSLRGNTKEIFWPVPLSETTPNIEQLTLVRLVEDTN